MIEFEKPLIISPMIYDSFEKLYDNRQQIIELKLVPIKHDNMHKIYHEVDHNFLAEELRQRFEKNEIFLLDNKFPYWLPEDINQQIIWINHNTDNLRVFNFLNTLSNQKAIVFERPLNVKTPLVKGSFPLYRHIHFWTKK